MRISKIKRITVVCAFILFVVYTGKVIQQRALKDWERSLERRDSIMNGLSHRRGISNVPEDMKVKDVDEMVRDTKTSDKHSLNHEMLIFDNKVLPFEAKMSKLHELRQERLHRECNRMNYKGNILDSTDLKKLAVNMSVLVSDEYKLMFCSIGDAHSELWKNLFGRNKLRSLYSYREESTSYRLKFYHKFLVVQQPLLRLLAVYKSMRTSFRDFQLRLPYLPDDDSEERGPKALTANHTFPELLSIIAEGVSLGLQLPLSVESINVLCQPCFFNYDFILRDESLQEDIKHMFSRLELKLSNMRLETSGSVTLDEVKDRIPKEQLWSEVLDKIYEVYRVDHKAFGYPKLRI